MLSFKQKDWWERIQGGKLPVDINKYLPDLNENRVKMVEQIFGNLRLADVPGQPLIRDACGDWFVDLAKLAAGGLDADGLQNVNQMLLMVPKKNSKSTYSALLVLSLMLMSVRPRATFLFVAPTREISEIAFQAVVGAILVDDTLREALHIKDHKKQIVSRKSGCVMQIKTLDMKAITGVKPALCMLDELHLFTGKDDARIIGQIRGGMASIPEAQLIMTTTQSDVAPSGVWKAELIKSRGVRDGTVNLEGYCPVLYELPKELSGDMKHAVNPKHWKALNPNINRSVDIEWLKTSFLEARSSDVQEQMRWLSQHANIEVSGFRLADDEWGGAANWSKCASSEVEDFDFLIDNAAQIAVGIDGGGVYDLLGCTVTAVLHDGRWATRTVATLQRDALNKMKKIASLLLDFEKDGDLKIFKPGEDIAYIADLIVEIYNKAPDVFMGVGIDAAGLGPELTLYLIDKGLPEDLLVTIPQGWRLNAGYIAAERRIAQRSLIHGNQPLFNWNISNTVIQPSGRPGKSTNKMEKIDCTVALMNSIQILLDTQNLPIDVNTLII